jgi:adenylate cyclase
MFCDLRGFTTLAEGLQPDRVIEVLNRYLGMVSGAVFDHGGTVVSYQGDGVMAVFGAPIEQPDHARRALDAARQIAGDGLPRFNRWLHDHQLSERTLAVGIGVNTGAVMSGSVGSERRLEYAAVGDATNVAARLQALSRDAPERIFVAATTVDQIGGPADGLRRFGEIELRGRSEPVVVYALGSGAVQ